MVVLCFKVMKNENTENNLIIPTPKILSGLVCAHMTDNFDDELYF